MEGLVQWLSLLGEGGSQAAGRQRGGGGGSGRLRSRGGLK